MVPAGLRRLPLASPTYTLRGGPSVASVALSLLGLGLGLLAIVLRQRAVQIVRLLESTLLVAPDIPLVGSGVDQLALSRGTESPPYDAGMDGPAGDGEADDVPRMASVRTPVIGRFDRGVRLLRQTLELLSRR